MELFAFERRMNHAKIHPCSAACLFYAGYHAVRLRRQQRILCGSDSAAYEQFNLTIATGDYPDLMAMDYYSGGVTAAYEDDIIIDLTAVKNQYNCTYPIFIDNSAVLEGFTGAFGTAGINLGWTDLGMMMDGDTVVSSLTDESWSSYVQQCESMDLARCVEIYQTVYNRMYKA